MTALEATPCMYPACTRRADSERDRGMGTYRLRLALCDAHGVTENRDNPAWSRWLHGEMDRQERE